MPRKSTTDRLVSQWETVQNWLDGTESTDCIALSGIDYDPRDVRSRDDVRWVLGLSEREFVGAVLLDNGGRVMQRAFAEYTNWSPSQVSRVLTGLEDDGAIVRIRDGRENIVSFPRRRGTRNREANDLVNEHVSSGAGGDASGASSPDGYGWVCPVCGATGVHPLSGRGRNALRALKTHAYFSEGDGHGDAESYPPGHPAERLADHVSIR